MITQLCRINITEDDNTAVQDNHDHKIEDDHIAAQDKHDNIIEDDNTCNIGNKLLLDW